MILRLLLTALSLGFGPAAMASDLALFSMTGNWHGTGMVRTGPDQPERDGRCRMLAESVVEGQEVRLKGRCATPQGASEMTMQFALRDANTIAGGVASPSLPETIQFVGTADGNITRLQSRATIALEPYLGRLQITLTMLDHDHFDLVEWFQPETQTEAILLVQMQFERAGGD